MTWKTKTVKYADKCVRCQEPFPNGIHPFTGCPKCRMARPIWKYWEDQWETSEFHCVNKNSNTDDDAALGLIALVILSIVGYGLYKLIPILWAGFVANPIGCFVVIFVVMLSVELGMRF